MLPGAEKRTSPVYVKKNDASLVLFGGSRRYFWGDYTQIRALICLLIEEVRATT